MQLQTKKEENSHLEICEKQGSLFSLLSGIILLT